MLKFVSNSTKLIPIKLLEYFDTTVHGWGYYGARHTLANMWSSSWHPLIRGTPCHSESNGVIERRNRTFAERLGSIMVE